MKEATKDRKNIIQVLWCKHRVYFITNWVAWGIILSIFIGTIRLVFFNNESINNYFLLPIIVLLSVISHFLHQTLFGLSFVFGPIIDREDYGKTEVSKRQSNYMSPYQRDSWLMSKIFIVFGVFCMIPLSLEALTKLNNANGMEWTPTIAGFATALTIIAFGLTIMQQIDSDVKSKQREHEEFKRRQLENMKQKEADYNNLIALVEDLHVQIASMKPQNSLRKKKIRGKRKVK